MFFISFNLKNLQLSEAKKILIIRLSSLGDVLLTTPVVRSLQQSYPNLSIDFLIKNNFADAIRLNPNISKTIIYDDSHELLKQLKNNKYDLVIDLHNNFRSKKIVRQLKLPAYKFVKPNFKKFILVHFKINLLKDIKPISQRYADVIPNFELDRNGLELFIPESFRSELEEFEKVIGICPGAFHFTKRWPLEFYAEFGRRLTEDGYKVAILGGESERDICKDLQKKTPTSVDLSNNNKLFQTAAHMKNCKTVICNDSGLMHTAAAMGIPLISIFGSTVREFGFAPYGVRNWVVENPDLNCRPCTHIGKSRCSKKHFKCMNEITPSLVYEKFKNLLGSL